MQSAQAPQTTWTSPSLNTLSLTKVRDIQAAQNSAKARRIERMAAAKSDPKMTDIITRTNGELRRIGFADGVNDDAVSTAV